MQRNLFSAMFLAAVVASSKSEATITTNPTITETPSPQLITTSTVTSVVATTTTSTVAVSATLAPFICPGVREEYYCVSECSSSFFVCPHGQPGIPPIFTAMAPGNRCPCPANKNCVLSTGAFWQAYESQCKDGHYFGPLPETTTATATATGQSVAPTNTAGGGGSGNGTYITNTVDCRTIPGCEFSESNIVLKFGLDMVGPTYLSFWYTQKYHPENYTFTGGVNAPVRLLDRPTQNGYYEFCMCFPKQLRNGPMFEVIAINGTTPGAGVTQHVYPHGDAVDAYWALNKKNYIYLGNQWWYDSGCCGFEPPILGPTKLSPGGTCNMCRKGFEVNSSAGKPEISLLLARCAMVLGVLREIAY